MDILESNSKYNQTTFYLIKSKDENINDCYIGHTTNLYMRQANHKSSCKKKKNTKLYNFINENGGWNNWEMLIIEKDVIFNSQLKAVEREQYYLNHYNSNLNEYQPLKDYKKRTYRQKWYEKHRYEQLERVKRNNTKKISL